MFKKSVKNIVFLGVIFTLGFFSSGLSQDLQKRIEVSHFPTLNYQGFKIVYDGRNKIPLYTHEYLTPNSLLKSADRSLACFCEDSQIYPYHRSSLDDYIKSGFDRGHMAAAANHVFSQEIMDETFFLSNVCPQNPSFNRHYWSKLEKYIRAVVKSGAEVEVITGPLFLPIEENDKKYIKYQIIGESNVAVPTHFFKIIKTLSNDPKIDIYIIPNQPIDTSTPLHQFLTNVPELEKISGLKFKLI